MSTVYTCSIAHMQDFKNFKHKFVISIKCPYQDPNVLYAQTGFKWMPVLAPYTDLFHEFLYLKKNGMWTQEAFDSWYTPLYTQHVLNDRDCCTALNYLYYTLKKGDDVVLACFCSDVKMCHRKIAAHLLEEKGFQAVYR